MRKRDRREGGGTFDEVLKSRWRFDRSDRRIRTDRFRRKITAPTVTFAQTRLFSSSSSAELRHRCWGSSQWRTAVRCTRCRAGVELSSRALRCRRHSTRESIVPDGDRRSLLIDVHWPRIHNEMRLSSAKRQFQDVGSVNLAFDPARRYRSRSKQAPTDGINIVSRRKPLRGNAITPDIGCLLFSCCMLTGCVSW